MREGLGGVAAAVLVTEGNFHDVDSCELGYTIAVQPPCEPFTRALG